MAQITISSSVISNSHLSYRPLTKPSNSEDTTLPGIPPKKDGYDFSTIKTQKTDGTSISQEVSSYPENMKNRSSQETEKKPGEKQGNQETEKKQLEIKEKKKDGTDFTEQELKQIKELKSRDTEVKAHEQAHISAGGQYVKSGAHYQYQTGPDGNKYAVGGEVEIDVSKISNDPQSTITKMETIIRSALAPAQPSGQDRSVAAQAQKAVEEARQEIMEARSEKLFPDKNNNKSNNEGTNAYSTHILGDKSQKEKSSINIYA